MEKDDLRRQTRNDEVGIRGCKGKPREASYLHDLHAGSHQAANVIWAELASRRKGAQVQVQARAGTCINQHLSQMSQAQAIQILVFGIQPYAGDRHQGHWVAGVREGFTLLVFVCTLVDVTLEFPRSRNQMLDA